MQIIGITGGTGCGKTTALNSLRRFGGAVLDCDALYHNLLQTDRQMLDAIRARFPDAFDGDQLDRKRLGAVVFDNKAALEELNQITGRYVIRAVMKWLEHQREAGISVAAIDAIGLLESGIGEMCDRTVAILAPTEARVQRLIARENISEEYARLRIAAQRSNESFAADCDVTIMNDADSSEDFGRRCDEVFAKILEEETHHE